MAAAGLTITKPPSGGLFHFQPALSLRHVTHGRRQSFINVIGMRQFKGSIPVAPTYSGASSMQGIAHGQQT
jgi:hypothetical protein